MPAGTPPGNKSLARSESKRPNSSICDPASHLQPGRACTHLRTHLHTRCRAGQQLHMVEHSGRIRSRK